MGFKNIVVLCICLIFSGCISANVKPSEKISIDAELIRESDYIDIVYENGILSYVSYLKKEDVVDAYKKPSCNHISQEPAAQSKGTWIWDYKRILGHEKDVVERLSKDKFRKVYIQIGRDIEALKPFLKEAKAAGIEVFALDGAPEYIDNYDILIEDIKRIKAFNQENRDIGFNGVQFDVEPYLKKDFNIRKDYYLKRYVNMVHELRHFTGRDIGLSFVLPFWFDKLFVDGKPLSFHIIDSADEVVIMSYRTDYSEIVESAYNELCYASGVGKPLFLSLEINSLPEEQHFVIDKKDVVKFLDVIDNKTILSKSPYNGLPAFRKYEVKSEKITFFKRKDAIQSIIGRVPPFKSFSGYIIHSYEGLHE